MRYTERLKSSWSYHWSIFREIWDMFTLRNWCWLVVGLLVALCVVPNIGCLINPVVHYYATNSLPPLAPAFLQDIIPDYYWGARESPPFLLVLNYYWVTGSGFNPLTSVLCLVTAGLLFAGYLRGNNKHTSILL